MRRLLVGSIALIVLAIGGLWVEHSLPIELPRPTGPAPVGRTSRAFGADLIAWMWYPARHDERVASYLTDDLAERVTLARSSVINLLTRRLAGVRAHGVVNAPFADGPTAHPVVLFRGGGGRGAVLGFTAHFEELASRGYVVVALEGGVGGNPESCVGRADEDACAATLVANAGMAMGAALDRLSAISTTDPVLGGRLDLTTIGVFGHSFGGTQAFSFCAADARCQAGINMDGRLFGGLDQRTVRVPFLWLLSDHGAAQDAVSGQILAAIQRAYERQPTDVRLKLMIRGANHFTFSEDGALLKSSVLRGGMRVLGLLGMSGRRQVEVSAFAVATFFDAWLRPAGRARTMLMSPAYPELVERP